MWETERSGGGFYEDSDTTAGSAASSVTKLYFVFNLNERICLLKQQMHKPVLPWTRRGPPHWASIWFQKMMVMMMTTIRLELNDETKRNESPRPKRMRYCFRVGAECNYSIYTTSTSKTPKSPNGRHIYPTKANEEQAQKGRDG